MSKSGPFAKEYHLDVYCDDWEYPDVMALPHELVTCRKCQERRKRELMEQIEREAER